MKRQVLLVVMVLSSIHLFSQAQKSDIVTDRPDQTEAPSLVPQGGLQVESGFAFERDHEQNIDQTNYTYNSTLIKYGVNEFFELRFITEYLGERTKIAENTPAKIQGFSPLALGVKIKLAEEKGLWPQTAFIGHINFRSGSKEFYPGSTAVDFRFTFAHTLNEKLSLSYNLGAEWGSENPDAAFIYTLSLGYAITSKLGCFVEGYSFFPEKSKADNRVDAGITYKVSPVVQWDISGGIGLSSNAPDSFIGTGISFRLFK